MYCIEIKCVHPRVDHKRIFLGEFLISVTNGDWSYKMLRNTSKRSEAIAYTAFNMSNNRNKWFGCLDENSFGDFFEVHSIRKARPFSCHCNEPMGKVIRRKWFKQIKFARLLFSFALIFSPIHLTFVLFIHSFYLFQYNTNPFVEWN